MHKKSGKAKPAKKPYRITKKRSGRYMVKKNHKIINGIEKVKILLQEGLIKTGLPKPKAAAE